MRDITDAYDIDKVPDSILMGHTRHTRRLASETFSEEPDSALMRCSGLSVICIVGLDIDSEEVARDVDLVVMWMVILS